jgi:hypothetical protein
VWYVCQFIHRLLGVRYWMTQLFLSVHSVPDCSHRSLIIPSHISIILGKVIRSRLRNRQLRLVLCPPIILCSIHILAFIIFRCVVILTIHEHLLVIDRSWRMDLLVKIELSYDSILIVILNHPEVNHPYITLPLVIC